MLQSTTVSAFLMLQKGIFPCIHLAPVSLRFPLCFSHRVAPGGFLQLTLYLPCVNSLTHLMNV